MSLTTESFISRAEQIHNYKYDYSKVEYINMKTKVLIICPIHGEFMQTPDKHIHNRCGCPVCAGNIKSDSNDFISKAKAIHSDTYDYSLVKYVNNRTAVSIKCPIHGVFEQAPFNHLKGKGCPKCANNVRLTTDEFITKAKQVHGDKYNYDSVVYTGNRNPVKILCDKHGYFNQKPYAHLLGAGCPKCGIDSQVAHRDETSIRIKAANTCLNKYGVANPMYDVSIRNKHKQIVSSKEVEDKRNATKRKNNSFNSSLSEYRLGEFLKNIFGDDDVFSNYSSDAYPFKCDYYIKSRDLYIELNAHWSHGGHWYSKDDESIVSDWLTKSKFYQNAATTFSIRDVEKRMVARDNNLNYLVFWKSDLSDVKQWIDCGCPDGQDWKREYSWL